MRKLQFSPVENATLHILPKAEVDQQLKSGFPHYRHLLRRCCNREQDEWKSTYKVDFNEGVWQLTRNHATSASTLG
jgi:hypothetical protein